MHIQDSDYDSVKLYVWLTDIQVDLIVDSIANNVLIHFTSFVVKLYKKISVNTI